MTQRHPDEALVTNPQDTAPPTPCPGQQSPRHGATQSTPCSPILMARRHPHHALVSNPHGTATPTRDAQQQSPWHSATHATRPAAIPMAQRHPRDTPTSNPHGTAPPTPHARHARRPSSQPATAFHGTAPHTRHARRSLPLRSQKCRLQAHTHKSTDSLAGVPRFRNAQRAPAHAICRLELNSSIPPALLGSPGRRILPTFPEPSGALAAKPLPPLDRRRSKHGL